MECNSVLDVKKDFTFFYGADIQLFTGAKLTLGNSFINCNCKIRCFSSITIGDGCAISHEVTIMDADGHGINGKNEAMPVVIENNVWIGTRVIILKGVHIYEGAVIAAGAVVTHDIPARAVAAGVPARIVRENIDWNK